MWMTGVLVTGAGELAVVIGVMIRSLCRGAGSYDLDAGHFDRGAGHHS